MQRTCQRTGCTAVNPANAQYCHRCGARLVDVEPDRSAEAAASNNWSMVLVGMLLVPTALLVSYGHWWILFCLGGVWWLPWGWRGHCGRR